MDISKMLLTFLCASFFSTSIVWAGLSEEWVRKSPDTAGTHGAGYAMTTDAMGNIYVAGGVEVLPVYNYASVIKYDKEGNILWSNKFYGANNATFTSIVLDNDCNVYVNGATNQVPGDNKYISCTVKYDRNGAQQWVRYYVGILSSNGPWSILMTSDGRGGILVAGHGNVGGYASGTAIVKYSNSGDLVWEKRNETGDISYINGHLRTLIADKYGNVIITGVTSSEGNPGLLFIAKYDRSGNLLWESTTLGFKYHNYVPHDITLDKDNNILVTGQIDLTTLRQICFTAKYSASGNLIWQSIYTYSPENYIQNTGRMIAVDDNGNVIVGGICGTITGLFVDYFTIKYSSRGDSLWVQRFHKNNRSNRLDAMTVDHLGSVYEVGQIDSAPGIRWGTISYDCSGNQTSFNIYNDAQCDGQPNAILADNCGNVFVTGGSYELPNRANICTIKYSTKEAASRRTGSNPTSYSLNQNFPNPFNPSTKISYSVPAGFENSAAKVNLTVYDMLGREVAVLVNESMQPGTYEIVWNSSDMPSGVYFYTLSAGNYRDTKRMVLLK